MAKLLLTSKANVNAKDDNGKTPLHMAARQGSKDVVELLLANHANVDAKDNEAQTPLYEAASNGRKDAAEVLLAHGAEVNNKDKNGPDTFAFYQAQRQGCG